MGQPDQPRQTSEYARACLAAFSASGLGSRISIGGAFGLAHYYEYRTTHDVDAWWVEPVTQEEREQIIALLVSALSSSGEVVTRAWGDVASVELRQQGKTVFSFQVARRSAELRPPIVSPWPGGVLLDSLDDLIASKMTALVERGAPRDIRDIYVICSSGLSSARQCWALWKKRQGRAGENEDRERAILAVQTHLARLEQARPLESIADERLRDDADQVRTWLRKELLSDFEG